MDGSAQCHTAEAVETASLRNQPSQVVPRACLESLESLENGI